MSFFNTQMFLVMDTAVLPEHIKQTFRLYPNEHGWESDLSGIDVAVQGQDIDLHAYGYVVVYANDQWHANEAVALFTQLRELRKDAVVLGIPVEVEAETTRAIGWKPPFPGQP